MSETVTPPVHGADDPEYAANLRRASLASTAGSALEYRAWRVPFLCSIFLVLIALFIRVRLKESPTFVELEKYEQVEAHPLGELTRHSLPSVLRGIGFADG